MQNGKNAIVKDSKKSIWLRNWEKKEPERCKGKRIANIEEIRKTGKGNKSTTEPKKETRKTSTSPAYKGISMLTKAVKKVESMLPKSPRKR